MKEIRVGVAVIVAQLLAGPVGAFEAPPIATGQIWFMHGDRVAMLDYNAHEEYTGHFAKGWISYEDWGTHPYHRYYLAEVDCVEVQCAEATFSGQIYETSEPDWRDRGVQIWVIDGGTPGTEGDKVAGEFFDWPGCLPFMAPMEWFDVTAGNQVVHFTGGDLNCDGFINFADINPFVLALAHPAGYQAKFPDCDWFNADVDCDGDVDFHDINPFVDVLCHP